MVLYTINEIYPCLQGEGINLGLPSLLLRFQICNLRCTWCDSNYTHTMKSDKNIMKIELSMLIEKIKSFPQKNLILTGGEPTLQNIAPIMRALQINSNYSFEVETNGTLIPHEKFVDFLIEDYLLAQWNISPKFSNAGEEIEDKALRHWAQLASIHERIYFKFVIRENFAQSDLQEILSIINRYNLDKNAEKIILMPEGLSIESQTNNEWLHDICLQYGFRYTARLHVLLFENLRGR